MEVIEMRVTLTPSEAAEVVGDKLAGGIVSAELLDSYNRRAADGKEVPRTLVADNLDGNGTTRVRLSAGGGGNSLFWRFDWGAGESFAQEAANALETYQL